MSKEFHERKYQIEASNALYEALKGDPESNPIVVAPGGSGKTVILCKIIDLILSNDPHENILVLSHDKRILTQNFNSLEEYFDGIDIGMYSSGLKTKEIKKITVAGIQSIFRRPDLFENFGIVLIDECHLVTIEQTGMYRKFIDALPMVQVGGLTATHFRTGHGYIHKGDNALFNVLAYDGSSTENFNKLIDDGYLSQLFSKPTSLKYKTDGVKTLAGDFSAKDMSEKFDRESLTEAAVIESIFYGKKYKHWLCFAIDISHAENIKKRFEAHDIPSCVLHSKMEEDEDRIISDYKSGKYRVLINVNMAAVGFDFPAIDLILLMRPTKSQNFHVQMIARGSRVVYKSGKDLKTKKQRLKAIKKGGKPHCLILDFAGNVSRLGPINHMDIEQKEKGNGKGEAITKECPDCTMINYGAAKLCCNCGFEFEFKESLEITAGEDEIIAKRKMIAIPEDAKTWVDVDSVSYSKFRSNLGTPEQILVRYRCGLTTVKEYIGIQHNGYAKFRAKNWIDFRWNNENENPPVTVFDFISRQEFIKKPVKILVSTTGKRPEVVDAKF